MEKTAKVVEITKKEVREDKNGNEYVNVQVRAQEWTRFVHPITNKMTTALGKVKESSFNAYKESYLDGKPQLGWDNPVGSFLMGAFVTRDVEPYTIPVLDRESGEPTGEERTVSTATLLIIGDTTEEANFEREVQRVFSANDFTLVEEEVAVPTPEGVVAGDDQPF